MKNLESNPYFKINTVDQIGRSGFRFKGVAEVFREGDAFNFLVNDIHAREGVDVPVRAGVKVDVLEARPVLSPAYFLHKGITEAQVRAVWMRRCGYRPADQG